MPRLPLKEIDYDKRMRELDEKEKRIKNEERIRDRERELGIRHTWKKPTTTKLLMAFIFVNLTVVEIFSMLAMWHFANLDALYSLITAVISESLSFGIYAAKSFGENKEAELIKLERDKMAIENVVPEEDDEYKGSDNECKESDGGEEAVG